MDLREFLASRWPALVAITGSIAVGAGVATASSPGSIAHWVAVPRSPAHVLAVPTVAPTERPIALPGILGDKPRMLFAGTSLMAFSSDTLARSDDGGQTWTVTHPSIGLSTVLISPTNASQWVAGGLQVRISSDAGHSWQATKTQPGASSPYTILAMNPENNQVFFAAASNRLFVTRDGGGTWKEVTGVAQSSHPVMAFTDQPSRFVYAADSAVYLVDTGGNDVVTTGRGVLPSGVRALDVTGSGAPTTILVRGSDDHAYLSPDGSTWSRVSVSIDGPVVASEAHLWIADGHALLGAAADVELSTIGDVGGWSHASGLPRNEGVLALAVSPGAALVVAYLYGGDVYASQDGGVNWALSSTALRAPPPATPLPSPAPT